MKVTAFPPVAFVTAARVSGGRSSTMMSSTWGGSTPPSASVALNVIVCGPPASRNGVLAAIEVHGPESTRYQIVGGPWPVRSGELNDNSVDAAMYVAVATTIGVPMRRLVAGKLYTVVVPDWRLFVSSASGTALP